MKLKLLCIAMGLSLLPACTKSCGAKKEQQAEVKASVFFVEPKNNDQLSSPVKVVFGVKGMMVRPALEDVSDQASGHHHILIDHPQGFIEKGQPVPVNERHIHYGKGETEAIIELAPGVHTLSLQFADGAHLSYGKDLAATITVTVVEQAPAP
jgi:hypothetical protein